MGLLNLSCLHSQINECWCSTINLQPIPVGLSSPPWQIRAQVFPRESLAHFTTITTVKHQPRFTFQRWFLEDTFSGTRPSPVKPSPNTSQGGWKHFDARHISTRWLDVSLGTQREWSGGHFLKRLREGLCCDFNWKDCEIGPYSAHGVSQLGRWDGGLL